MTDSTDVTDFTNTANGIPRREHGVLHGGNTAPQVGLETRSNKGRRSFLSLLSGLCLAVVRVKRVPTVQATRQLAIKPEQPLRT
jgi:hypothetical protein